MNSCRQRARRSLATGALVMALATGAAAQDAPILREEGGVKVTTSGQGTPAQAEPKVARAPEERTNIVGIVNAHVLTREQLDRQLEARSNGLAGEVLRSGRAGIVANIDPDGAATMAAARNAVENILVENQQEEAVRAALRDLEGTLVREWMEQKLLADEARRHGFVISKEEFEARMADIERDHLGKDSGGARVLEVFGISRDELEAQVNEALLVEKLLARWVELNMTEEELRAAYEKDPSLFVTPPLYRAPLFTIVLLGDETPAEIRGLQRLAEEVRSRLRAGEDPEAVFADERFDIHQGVYGADLGYYNLQQNTLPPEVAAALRQLKVGEVSEVLTQYVSRNGKAVPESLHVVMLADKTEQTGDDFESALPKLRESSMEVARQKLLAALRASGTHRMITNTRGIPPGKVPSRDELSTPRPPIELTSG